MKKLFPFAFAFALAACASSSNSVAPAGDAAGTPTPTTSPAQISACKEGCDKMKFFDCASAEDQAGCYADCNVATSDQIELFTACARNSTCDPSCRTTIQPKPKPPAPPADGGPTSDACQKGCNNLERCGKVPAGGGAICVAECEKQGYGEQFRCFATASCADLEKTCGATSDEIDTDPPKKDDAGPSGRDEFEIRTCQAACDSVKVPGCIDAAGQAACRARCETADRASRSSFESCTRTAGDCEERRDCLTAFSR
jgi:hypothetical protein